MQTPGDILKAEREKRGLSIKEVEQATSIRSLYLSAIEEGKYSVVPGEVYLKGFIRNYANFLELDGPQLVELYRQNQQPAPILEEVQPKTEGIPAATKTAEAQEEASFAWGKILLGLCLAGAIAGGAWWYLQSPVPAPAPVEQKPIVPSAPKAQTQPANPQPVSPAVPPNSPTVPTVSKPISVTAKFTDECWTRVVVDGKEIYEGIPKIGETITWDGQQTVVLKLGNASAVDVMYNGQAQPKLGDKGEVVEKTYIPKR